MRTNHHRGIAKAAKEQRRKEAEERNAKYQLLTVEQKLARQPEGGKVWAKIKHPKGEA